ncbi:MULTISPECIES: MFS transporter [Heyndrickxia]|uniref:MFS transporter n=1 Tax=Heyndrickxia TaxID=2837504 RepID=UPI002DB7B9F1|nr:MFS transporter [Weizmannia sp. CD-2023]MEC2305284.1 MFS transporter [Weizmannia sp. CD-2023]MEC2341365.1 MFS transporter [Weizmannia sp. CD-2023]
MTKKKLSLVVGILSMNLLLMAGSVVGAAIAAIAKSFPKEPISKVQMLSSLPTLGQLIATLIFSYLAFRLTQKNLGLLAVGLVTIGGLVPAFWNSSLNVMLACMVVMGFGLGLISNAGPILLQRHFEGEERASVMGWSVGVTNIGMMVLTAFGGILGGTDWRNLFWVYAIAAAVFLLVFFLIPKDEIEKNGEKGEKTNVFKVLKSLNGYVYFILIVTFVTSLCMMTFLSNLSIAIAQKGSGGTTYTGMVQAIGNIGGILTAFGLKYIRKLTKRDTIAWGFIAFALAFVCIVFSSNIVMHVIGNMFSGMGIVLINATIPYELSILSNPKQFTVAISMNTLISSLAGVISPIMLAAVHIPAGYSSFVAGAVLSLAMAAVLFVIRFGTKVEKVHASAQELKKTGTF